MRMYLKESLKGEDTPRKRAIFNLESRRNKKESWIRDSLLRFVVDDLIEGNLSPEDIDATEEEAREIQEIMKNCKKCQRI